MTAIIPHDTNEYSAASHCFSDRENRPGGRRFKSCPRYQPRGPGLNRDRALPRARHVRRRHPAPRPVRARHQSVNGDAEETCGQGDFLSGPGHMPTDFAARGRLRDANSCCVSRRGGCARSRSSPTSCRQGRAPDRQHVRHGQQCVRCWPCLYLMRGKR